MSAKMGFGSFYDKDSGLAPLRGVASWQVGAKLQGSQKQPGGAKKTQLLFCGETVITVFGVEQSASGGISASS
jgi:hypothetical protein